jgi:hypothetical protein
MKGKRGERPDTAEQKPNDDAEPIAPAPAEPKPDDDDKPAVRVKLSSEAAAAPAAPADTTIAFQPERIVKETIRHKFTIAELAEIADKMGRAAAHVYAIERQKSEQAAHYGAELKAANLAHGDLVERFNQKYEMRDVECRIVYDKPEPGYKSYVRTDGAGTIREVPMTDAEKQRAFVFDAGDGKPQ